MRPLIPKPAESADTKTSLYLVAKLNPTRVEVLPAAPAMKEQTIRTTLLQMHNWAKEGKVVVKS